MGTSRHLCISDSPSLALCDRGCTSDYYPYQTGRTSKNVKHNRAALKDGRGTKSAGESGTAWSTGVRVLRRASPEPPFQTAAEQSAGSGLL